MKSNFSYLDPFFLLALRKATSEYDARVTVSGTTDHAFYTLGWTVDELSRLNKRCRQLTVDVTLLIERVENQNNQINAINYALSKLQEHLTEFVMAVSRHRRIPGTHILITMVSPCERSKKPYALPICCMPYAGLTESKARTHIISGIAEMTERGMKVEGTCIIVN